MFKKVKITITDLAKANFINLIKTKEFTLKDQAEFEAWQKRVLRFGSGILCRAYTTKEMDDPEIAGEVLKREPPQNYNRLFYRDHALHSEYLGYRASDLDGGGRIIYKVMRSKVEIVEINKITKSHNYKKEW